MLSEVIADNPLQFIVIPFDSPKNQIVIEAKSLDQKRLWTTKLKNLMLKHYPGAKISEHVQQLVMQLGNHSATQGNTSGQFSHIMLKLPDIAHTKSHTLLKF